MVNRTLELTLISAKDLKHVTIISKMEVYAISSIDGDPGSQQLTATDRTGGTNPSWNTTLRFSIPPDDPSRHHLHILLRCHRPLGDKSVGEVQIPLNELLNGNQQQFISYQVHKISSNRVRGVINLSCRVIEEKAGEPMMAYPPGASSATYPPPPPVRTVPYAQPYQPGSGYVDPPPTAGYGYPPTGYGYGMAQPGRPVRNNRFGMGTGLLGGALGGLVVGDMLSDHGGGYGGGYDGGYGGGYGGGYDGGFDSSRFDGGACDGGFDGSRFDGGVCDDGGYDDGGGFDDGGAF